MGEGKVLALIKGGHRAEVAKAGEEVEILLDKTPFYGSPAARSATAAGWQVKA